MNEQLSTRETILKAAAEIVQEQGAMRMTMDAVAARAKVSKGGLIYHFPTQSDLLRAMVDEHITYVEELIAYCRNHLSPGPGREVKAFIRAWFDMDEDFKRSANALLAVVTREPALADAIRKKHREIVGTLMNSQPDNDLMAILVLAAEGMWMSELLSIDFFSKSERKHIEQTLMTLADKSSKKFEE